MSIWTLTDVEELMERPRNQAAAGIELDTTTLETPRIIERIVLRIHVIDDGVIAFVGYYKIIAAMYGRQEIVYVFDEH
jgi:hypothetical protein